MLTYDQHVSHGGLTFRVRTEPRHRAGDLLIVSSLHFGDQLVSTRRVRLGPTTAEASGLRLAEVLDRYHHRILSELSRGHLDQKIASTPGTGEFRAVGHAETTGKRGQEKPAKKAARRKAATSLDSIVLNFLDSDARAAPPDASPRGERGPAANAASTREGAIELKEAAPEDFSHARTTAVGVFEFETTDGELSPQTAFSGDLQVLAVPDLLDFLSMSRRTGTLVVVGPRGIAEVHLQAGMLSGCVASCCRSIGALLLEAGAVSETELAQAATAQDTVQTDWSLGAILTRSKTVERGAVELALARQAHEVLRELVQWTSGRFTFDPEGSNTWHRQSEIEIELDTRGVLLDVMRQLDEESRD